jgi:hypothetical protein
MRSHFDDQKVSPANSLGDGCKCHEACEAKSEAEPHQLPNPQKPRHHEHPSRALATRSRVLDRKPSGKVDETSGKDGVKLRTTDMSFDTSQGDANEISRLSRNCQFLLDISLQSPG